MSTIFKSLAPSDYSITPFPAYYDYTYTYMSGSTTNPVDVQMLYGSRINSSSIPLRTANAEYDLYDSIIQNFYSAIPASQYGITSSSYTPSGSVWVVSVSQDLYGDKIVPGTFSVVVNSTSSYDNGHGDIIVSQSGTSSIVGNVFYDKGIAVLKPLVGGTTALTVEGICIVSGSSVDINFTSSLQIYEHSIKVKVNPDEFLYSLSNPTVEFPATGETMAPATMMHTRELLPYVTTIGFYNSFNELLLVAKISYPIQRTTDITQTFVVKFDT